MSQIKVMPLGAGQDVGRSCVIVTLNGRTIMFDCGAHMGFRCASVAAAITVAMHCVAGCDCLLVGVV